MSERRRRHRRVVRGGTAERAEREPPAARTGPVIPDRAAEDTAAAWGEGEDDAEERLRRDVPPHW